MEEVWTFLCAFFHWSVDSSKPKSSFQAFFIWSRAVVANPSIAIDWSIFEAFHVDPKAKKRKKKKSVRTFVTYLLEP